MRLPNYLLFALGVVSLAYGCHPTSPGHEGHPHGDEEETKHGAKPGDNEEPKHDARVIHLSDRAILRSGIRVQAASQGSIATSIEVPAEVQLNPDRVAHVAPLVTGQLREVRAALGDHVEAGDSLAVLRSVELGQARAEYRRARAMLKVARSNRNRQERLHSEGISSERAYLEAQFRMSEAKAERDGASASLQVFGVQGGSGGPDLELTAPISGVIIERHATHGENVSTEDNLFVIADLSTVWVIGRVYEQHVSSLQNGMSASLTLRAFPGRTWSGEVAYIGSTLNEETRSLAIRVETDNADGLLRPGLFGTLRIRSEGSAEDDGLVLPKSAVQELRGQTVVFVSEEEKNTFRAVSVVTGAQSSNLIEVLEGLKAGARVVVDGAFILKSQLLRGELGEGHAH